MTLISLQNKSDFLWYITHTELEIICFKSGQQQIMSSVAVSGILQWTPKTVNLDILLLSDSDTPWIYWYVYLWCGLHHLLFRVVSRNTSWNQRHTSKYRESCKDPGNIIISSVTIVAIVCIVCVILYQCRPSVCVCFSIEGMCCSLYIP